MSLIRKNIRFPFLAILFLIGIASMSCVSAVTPTTSDIEIGLKVPIPIDSNDAKEFYPNVESNNWDPSIEKETPHFMLLILNKDGKANMLRAIEECYASKEEKAWMADFLQKMWEKYPAKFEKSDGSIYISIEGKEKGLGLTDEEKKGLEKVDFEITRYLNDLFSDDNSPKWSANEHSMIVNDSCHKWYVNEQLCRLAAQYAPGPDSWWSFPDNMINHYWNPDLPFIGQGRYYFDAYADISKTYYDDGNPGAAFCVLGWSSHFLTDLGNPLHTGKEAEQLWQGVYPNLPLYSWVHNNYEGYVNQYWSTPPPSGDYSFSYYVTNNWYYYVMTDPMVASENLAGWSHYRLDHDGYGLYYYIYNNPYTIQDEPNIYMHTANAMTDTSRHTIGLVKYIQD